MNIITYKTNLSADNASYKFGISAFCGDKLLMCVNEITDNESQIKELVDMCNEYELDICHLDDIIEDFLTDFNV